MTKLKLILFLVSSGLLGGSEATLTEFAQWDFDTETHQLQFKWEGNIPPNIFVLENPTRIVIDLPQTVLKTQPVSQPYPELVSEIRVGQFQPQITRLVMELAPHARLNSNTINLQLVSKSEGHQWQLTPKIETIQFPLSTLMTFPPVHQVLEKSPTTVNVPPPPRNESSLAKPLTLLAGKTFQLRYQGEKPLTLKVEQPWQEILFLEQSLTDEEGNLFAPAKTPVIGRFETTDQGTRFVAQALITNSIIEIQAHSHWFPRIQPSSSSFKEITIPPNTIFTLELIEDVSSQS